MMNLPSVINIELTQKCNKSCYMCGRRKIENANVQYNKDMDFDLLKSISKQIPEGILIQFHSNGEPTMYPYLEEGLKLFKKQIRCFDTNGKLLLVKSKEIIGNLDTITVSTFKDDSEWKEQYLILKDFLEIKGSEKPNVIIRCLGDIDKKRIELYRNLNCLMAYRILHSPMGSFSYEKNPVIPEHGICLEILYHPVINVDGLISICVRFDPNKEGVIGDLKKNTLEEIWCSEKRKQLLDLHISGKRNKILLCSKCEFWGVPRG